ncbi:MAG: nucleotidyltransferase family protein [bacterium]
MAKEEKFFLACLRFFLQKTGSPDEIRSSMGKNMDWNLILSWAQSHGVHPLLYHVLKGVNWTGIPGQVRERLESNFRANMARNLILSAETDKVLMALEKRGIISVPLKGIFLSEEVYPDISLRVVTDIDLLVREEDLAGAEEALVELGYCHDHSIRQVLIPNNCYTLHMEKGGRTGHNLCVELHWGLANRRDYVLPMESWWETVFQNTRNRYYLNGISCFRMEPEILLLYLTINAHMSRYAFLKQLVDIAQVISHYKHDMDWDKVIGMACELGLLDNLVFALGLVCRMFDLQVLHVADELSNRLASGKQRIFQALFREQRLVHGKMGQDLRQFILLFLLDEKVVIRSIWKVIFSSRQAIAYRYGLSPQSYSTSVYLILNPLLSLYRLLRGFIVDSWAGKGIGRS